MKVCFSILLTNDPLDWPTYEIEVPAGYGRVFRGRVQQGDLHFSCLSVRKRADGSAPQQWLSIFPLPAGAIREDYDVYSYACVVRPGALDEPACERCGHQRREKGERFCLYCGRVICQEGRKHC
jgi:hypothetical protein